MSNAHPQPQRYGYVLVLTLVLLGLVAAGLAGVARQSYRSASYATQLEQEAQRRWLSRSAENLLPYAAEILESQLNREGFDPAQTNSGHLQIDLDLGHHNVRLTLADEQTKANLNAFWDRHDPTVFNTKAQQLATLSGWNSRIQARPIGTFETTAAASDVDWPTFVSFEQVFPAAELRSHLNQTASASNVLDDFTLWGNGRLRWQNAPPEVLNTVLTPLLSPGQVAQLTGDTSGGSSGGGGGDGERSLDILNLTERQAERLADRVTDNSQCFSIRLRFDDGRCARTHLVVAVNDESDQPSSPTRIYW